MKNYNTRGFTGYDIREYLNRPKPDVENIYNLKKIACKYLQMSLDVIGDDIKFIYLKQSDHCKKSL